jgi:1-phosphofructokinase
MIVTVTLNPSVDRTVSIAALKLGSVNRVDLTAVDPGGKGVNVSRAVKAFGKSTHAILVCGSFGSRWFADRLIELAIPHNILLAAGVTRNNVTLVEGDGTVTKINEPGFQLTDAIITEVKSALSDLNLKDAWVVFAGRLNPGANAQTYLELANYARNFGAKIAVDASGAELKHAIQMSPDLIKPNQHELAELVGRPLTTIHEVLDAAKEVLAGGVKSILCSLGEDGALFINENGVIHAEPESKVVGVPVGAGDILLATFIAGGADVAALPGAVSWSAASVPLEGTAIPTPQQAANVKVRVNQGLDENRSLVEVN